MKYLADILTFSRIILAVALLIMSFTGAPIYAAFLVYMIGEITDALDGTCATKWPFPKDKAPWYRKYAAKYDMFADGFIAFAMLLFFTLRINLVAGLIIFIAYPLAATILEFIVYGKFMGHPDDCTKNSLIRRNFKLAKALILIRRNIYLALLFTVAVWTLYASEWSLLTKNIIMGIGLAGSLFFWLFLSQRRHNISRDAVDIEKKLSKK
ncbi:MAG: CDP-alcohol phosphatidyltransferase family protein [Candidatus Saccharibacteria bacterium]|nr:CDP-alcohol phosphatidyltransferase family protein [Candidatus Saccharibacteria bacterium]